MQKESRIPGMRLYFPELQLMEEVLTEKEFVAVMRALRRYVTEGEEASSLTGGARACFMFLKDRVVADMRAYREACERNRVNVERRWARAKARERAAEEAD